MVNENDDNFALSVQHVGHEFHNGTVKKVLYDINFDVRAGQIVSLVGGSGCGKSTLLRAILGTHPPTSGQILVDGEPVNGPSKNVGIVYQNYALYDFLNVEENIAFGLKLANSSIPFRIFRPFAFRELHKKHLEEARFWIDKVGLTGNEKAMPFELSGGMKQRVAVAQALIMRSSLLLLDEPFGALDQVTREGLQMLLLNLYQENLVAKKAGNRPPLTILIVTHEIKEALYVSDRIIGLSKYHEHGSEGSTVVYDKPSPVFKPTDPRDWSRFAAQEHEINEVVLSKKANVRHEKYIRIWDESDMVALPGDENLSLDRI